MSQKSPSEALVEEFQEEEIIRFGLDGVATTALRLLQRLATAEAEVERLTKENSVLIDRIHSLSDSS